MRFVKNPHSDKLIESIASKYPVSFKRNKDIVKIKSSDSLLEVKAQKAIEAFNQGFSTKKCIEIFKKDKDFRLINVKKLTSNRKRSKQQIGRIIGQNGKTKQIIEKLTKTTIKIKNQKVGIIGDIEDVIRTEKSVKDIINGKPVSKIYYDLEQYNSKENNNLIEYNVQNN